MKEHADYGVFCAEQAHFHYGDPFTRRDLIYYWLRGASEGFMTYLQDTKDSIDSLIATAEKAVRLRQRSVTRAERNLAWAEESLADLLNRKDLLLIRSWGREPNWQAIFDISDPTSAMYEYQEYWISQKGLIKSGMRHCETNQAVFSVGFETTTTAELAKNIAMVEFVMQYIRAGENNEKLMSIHNLPTKECSYSFIYNTHTNLYGILTESYMSRVDLKEFDQIETALAYLQSISNTDIVSEPDALPYND
ncbi:hypothetical protein [Pantoea ananatis]|uniref:hypothetical protein n=1 Tax=Pantoea ananas TaxID=553 RepID=UPI001FF0DDBD|nr:hypothetical protein [Pantoea ananatis]